MKKEEVFQAEGTAHAKTWNHECRKNLKENSTGSVCLE